MTPLFDSLALFLDRGPHEAALNMAIDEVLLSEMRGPVLRAYTWTLPAVSFGYFEKFAPVRDAHPDRELVRRWTGGGVVPHGEDFTYSLLVPGDNRVSQMPVGETYRLIHESVAVALNTHGLCATAAVSPGEKISHACFDNPVLHDVLMDGRKIAGAAQRRTRFGLLHQGSIQRALPTGFAELLAAALSKNVTAFDLSDQQLDRAEKLAAARYADARWTARI